MQTIPITLLFFASGAIGLSYEMIWVRILGLQFGHSAWAMSTVISAFMGGLALGSWWGGLKADKIKKPFHVYAWLELGIALFGLLSLPILSNLQVVLAPGYQLLNHNFYLFSLVRALLAFALLLIPTFLMGVTFPVLVIGVSRYKNSLTTVGWLYGINTAGAAIGVMVVGFYLFPQFGLKTTLYITVGAGILIGALAFLLNSPLPSFSKSRTTSDPLNKKSLDKALVGVAFICGFLGIHYQVLWTRLLASILGSSHYAFTVILSIFLIGIGTGSFVSSLKIFQWHANRGLIGTLIAFTSLFVGGGLFYINKLPGIYIDLAKYCGTNIWIFFLVQGFVTFLLVFVPTFFMGMILPLTILGFTKEKNISGSAVGNIYSVNTFGSIAGAIAAGFIFLPKLGVEKSIILGFLIGLIMAAYLVMTEKKWPLFNKICMGAGCLALLPLIIRDTPLIDIQKIHAETFRAILTTSKQRAMISNVIYAKDGISCSLTVNRSPDHTYFCSNGRGEGTTADDLPTQYLLGHLPLFFSNSPNKVCVIGLGAGATTRAVTAHAVKQVDVAEIEPAMTKITEYFTRINDNVLQDPRVKVFFEDGRTFLTYSQNKYDVIISQPSHPWVSGVSTLFTKEFYASVTSRLSEQGVFCQWIQKYEISDDTLGIVLTTLNNSFKNVLVFDCNDDLICVASNGPLTTTMEKSLAKFSQPDVQLTLSRIGINNPYDLFSSFSGMLASRIDSTRPTQENEDNNLILEFRAPLDMYLDATANLKMASKKETFAEFQRIFFNDKSSDDVFLGLGAAVAKLRFRTVWLMEELYALAPSQWMVETLKRGTILWPDENYNIVNDRDEQIKKAGLLIDSHQEKEGLRILLDLGNKYRLPWIERLIGIAYFKRKDFEKAETYFRASVNKNSEDYRSLTFLSVLKIKNQETQPAIDFLESALKISPQDRHAQKIREIYRNDKNEPAEVFNLAFAALANEKMAIFALETRLLMTIKPLKRK